jgi:hypothetical protein
MKIDGILWKVRREDGRVRLYLRSEAGQVVVKMETGMAMEVARELAFAAAGGGPSSIALERGE